MGTGKAQPLDAKILSINGYIRMGDIRVGTMVYGEDGILHKVIGVFPQGVKKVYTVTFSDGTSTECCDEHLWTYQFPQDRIKGRFRTGTLSEIRNSSLYYSTNRGDKNWKYYIPITKPVQFERRDLLIPPYVLGVILGDGHIDKDGVSITNSEDDIIRKIRSCLGDEYELKAVLTCNQNKSDYRVIDLKRTPQNNKNRLLSALRDYKLIGTVSKNKFIPKDYLLSSVEDRIELLRGLIDSDGYTSGGQITYYSTSRQLCNGVQFIVQSLGGTATRFVKENPFYTKRGKRVYCNDCYCLYIKLPDGSMACSSKKHHRNIHDVNLHTGVLRTIRDISYSREVECQCILLDSESHLYLTNDCIVTHNTSAAITYLTEHPDDRFIYITPYLDEAKRIKKGCPQMQFVEPSNKYEQYEHKKSLHTAALIEEGRNITTTHQAFRRYTPTMLDNIRKYGYTLIIDENVEVLETFDYHPGDLQLMVDGGYIKEVNGVYSLTDKKYEGEALSALTALLKSRELVRITDKNEKSLFYWALPPDLLTSFKDVFVLTYLFEGQSLHHFMEIYHIPYKYIGIEKFGEGCYRFGDCPGYVPEYVKNLKDMIHILDKGSVNDIGDDYHALSMNWFKRNASGVEQLKKNVSNCYNNIWRDIPADRRLWGSYVGAYNKVKGKGYSKSFLTFNAKATNAYKGKDCLVYIANLFMNVNEKTFYEMNGIKVDDDIFALSIMIQWIWRSAIRDGREVYLYIPSRRMRTLLVDWIDSVSKGGNGNG